MLSSVKNRFLFIVFIMSIFVGISFISRSILLFADFTQVDSSLSALFQIYAIGFFYDIQAFLYYIIPLVVYLWLMPSKIFNHKIHQVFFLLSFFVATYLLLFNAVSEWFFWEEFGKRFNFIAVDYLVYTHEVIHNILESYPIPLLVSLIFILTSLLFWFILKKTPLLSLVFGGEQGFVSRSKIAVFLLLLPVLSFNILNQQNLAKYSSNQYNNELSKNGFYSLFSAFRNNTLDYHEFYKSKDISQVMANLKALENFDEKTLKNIQKQGQEKHYNVMFIMVESLSASYMGIYGDGRKLTPHLDALGKKSLFFDHFYATGTRTVRGMEAVTLSIPPTAGRSIVKRPDNHGMYSAGFILQDKGYDSKFIYAGHGYFDNMNDFFGNNGFEVIDRTDFEKEEITFANVWGVCDEDLFSKSMQEADKSYAMKKPFFNFIMTTSNHRPYTYPDGKIDIPSHYGRSGGVKYTDYAIANFLEKAKTKPWFDETIFVIIADHNGGSAGKNALPTWRYRIPLFLYAPKLIEPQVISKLSSQIDIMPTLFSMLNWSYSSPFYGNDILDENFKPRAFIGNYQKLGLFRDHSLLVLQADKSLKKYDIISQTLGRVKYKEESNISAQEELDIISYYQSASYFYKEHIHKWKPKN